MGHTEPGVLFECNISIFGVRVGGNNPSDLSSITPLLVSPAFSSANSELRQDYHPLHPHAPPHTLNYDRLARFVTSNCSFYGAVMARKTQKWREENNLLLFIHRTVSQRLIPAVPFPGCFVLFSPSLCLCSWKP